MRHTVKLVIASSAVAAAFAVPVPTSGAVSLDDVAGSLGCSSGHEPLRCSQPSIAVEQVRRVASNATRTPSSRSLCRRGSASQRCLPRR